MEEKIICSMNGVGIYGVISICIFFAFFTGMLLWAFTKKAAYLNKMGNLPLDSGEKESGPHGQGPGADSARWITSGYQIVPVGNGQAAIRLHAMVPFIVDESRPPLGFFSSIVSRGAGLTRRLAKALGAFLPLPKVESTTRPLRCANCRGGSCCRRKSRQ